MPHRSVAYLKVFFTNGVKSLNDILVDKYN